MYTSIDEIKQVAFQDEFDIAVKLMQEKYFIINRNGKVFILHEDEKTGLVYTEVQSFKVFYQFLSFETYNGSKKQRIHVSDAFLNSSDTVRLSALIFDPKLKPGITEDRKYYNVWKGWKYQPVEGDVSKFLELLDINCNGDETVKKYFLDYLTHSLIYPEKLPMTSIVIKGEQGTGKGTLIQTICGLTDNSKHIEDIEQLVGNFNGHLTDAFYVLADELSFDTIKSANRLKTFISEKTRVINDKNRTAFTINSYVRLFILSNIDYVVNVEASDRRYVILNANSSLKGNFKWFDDYQKWLNNGGYEAIMYFLLNRDIKAFNPLEIPNTEAKNELKLKSADLPTKFLYDLLSGNITFRENMKEGDRIYRNELYEEFLEYCKKYHPKQFISTINEFNKVVVRAFNFDGDREQWRTRWKDKKGYYYIMPSIAEYQKRFSLNLFKLDAKDVFFNYEKIVNLVEDDEFEDGPF